MKVLSINVSQVKTVQYLDKEVTTGFYKRPCNGPIAVRKHNIDGDKQADLVNHGGESKAVYAFSYHHYEYWKTVFNENDLSFGAFGENLTVSHLDENELCIGDQVRCGTALLQVSQPRVPCFKFAMAFNNKQAPKLFIQNFHTGVYFRVLEEGLVNTEDELSIEQKHPNSVTVKTLFQTYFDKNSDNAESILLKAYAMPELSSEWKNDIRQKLKL